MKQSQNSRHSFFTPLSRENVAEIISKQERPTHKLGKGSIAIHVDSDGLQGKVHEPFFELTYFYANQRRTVYRPVFHGEIVQYEDGTIIEGEIRWPKTPAFMLWIFRGIAILSFVFPLIALISDGSFHIANFFFAGIIAVAMLLISNHSEKSNIQYGKECEGHILHFIEKELCASINREQT